MAARQPLAVGQIEKLGGLKVTAGGKRLEWVRDLDDVYAFHIEVPAGVKAVDLDFQFLSATAGAPGPGGGHARDAEPAVEQRPCSIRPAISRGGSWSRPR